MSLLAVVVCLVCVFACALCAWLLARSYFRFRNRLLFWSAACFVLLCASNLVLTANVAAAQDSGLSVIAKLATLFGISFLLYGFIWEDE